MFTRREEQVQDAINEVVKTRRDEIDWVLTDKTHRAGSDISPEALKARLTERYFTDFGNAAEHGQQHSVAGSHVSF